MKNLSLVTLLCAALLMSAPGIARAFETQSDAGDKLNGNSLLAAPQSLVTDFRAHSLAMPLSGKSSGGDGFVSSYGNSIPIPGPDIDQPAPAWASTPTISLH